MSKVFVGEHNKSFATERLFIKNEMNNCSLKEHNKSFVKERLFIKEQKE